MELVILSNPGYWHDLSLEEEVSTVNKLFENGLEHFHLRKPMFSVSELKKFLRLIDAQYLSRVTLHSFHDLVYQFPVGGLHTSEHQRKRSAQCRQQDNFLLGEFPHLRLSSSFHDLADLRSAPKIYEYTFISPIFDSISRPHYKASFSRAEIKSTLADARNKVIALGGVGADRLEDVKEFGFAGAGLLGAVWKAEDPIEAFLECKEASGKLPAVHHISGKVSSEQIMGV